MNGNNVVAAFSADQVAKLTGLTMRQLAYWDEIGFFRPQHAAENRRSPYSRIYSFQDIVGLRTVSVLRNAHGVSMPHLRLTAERLSKLTERPWSEIKLSVWKREVVWIDPETHRPGAVVTGQGILFEIIDVIEDMKLKAAALRARAPEEFGKIVRHRNVSHNQDVISGTRISVATVRNFWKAGYTSEQIIGEYPSLTVKDIEAAVSQAEAKTAA